ncbi:nitrite reductase large subunit NirB [Arhodomonas sp. AD133]|uniref:nitrite reductase large subunit NirB n=1 Tax=Arhodomonas sp. AD133 TaxID=3415009 RepID=UPI003EC004F1
MKEQLVVIGNGMAGIRTVEELLKLDRDKYDITVFGAEPHVNYNRILLSPVLAGEKTVDEIILNTREWYEDNGITLHTGDPVERIERGRRRVVSASGRETPYDRLLLATGSKPFVLPVPGNDLPGVVAFRDIGDVETMLEAAREHRHAVVIGGGLLGLEAANGLMKRGMSVTVVHLMDSLMERQLDKPASNLLRESLIERGLDFRMEAMTERILGRRRVKGVRFKDGSEVKADLVVMAAGIRPNIDLARDAGLHCDRGVVVHDTMQTYDPRVYAVGECVEHRKATYGLVAPIWEQAKVCANHLAQYQIGRYEGSVVSTQLKVTGIDLFSAGNYEGDETTEDIVFQDPRRGVYKKLVVKDNRLEGAVLYGDTADGPWYFDLMKRGEDIAEMRERLIFGRAYAVNDADAGASRAALMGDDEQVCDCNGVCKGAIVAAVEQDGLTSTGAVMKATKAGTSCGSCKSLVGEIVELTAGDAATEPEKPTVCECTDLSHDEVREAIRERHLTSPAAVREALGWQEPDGCAKCRPALNYYCISTHPAEAEDDAQSRFINERAHANIQKDGTYSVVPRMYGGVTNPQELRAIADVAEKFDIPTVKVTGGQRIDLLGVKKADLPAVWRELREQAGLESGHAYGKALRTVKTCVGKEWCRFGTQDSTAMGIDLERMTTGSWTPHKVKMAVSGCPRNCAESTIKDFGVIANDSGWELVVGGNGGTKLRAADVLCRVTTHDEVLKHAAAFMQIYREEAHYLERTAHWIDRVGLDYVRNRVVDDAEGRRAAYERFLDSQRHTQTDPWAPRSAPEAPDPEFQSLKEKL